MDKRELLFSITKKDFRVETYRASGKGGQNRNKRDTAVRITHIVSGAVGLSSDEREQARNKKIAFNRLVSSAKFKKWHRSKVQELLEKEERKVNIESIVEKQMHTDNLKIEVRDERGRWIKDK